MPPQEPQSPPPSPTAPEESSQNANTTGQPQYDFIFNDGQQPKASRRLPLPKLPKPILIGVASLLVLTVVIGLFMFRGDSGLSQPVISAAARAHEIARVSELVVEQSTDLNTQALASTVRATLISQEKALTTYLQEAGVKVESRALGQFQDEGTDEELQAATQENNLDATYTNYLKNTLNNYETALRSAASELSTGGQAVITQALAGTEVLLTSPQLATSQQ